MINIIHHNWAWAHGLVKREVTDAINIHHAAAENATPEAVHQWHLHNGWAGIGYQLYIRKDGTIHEGRPMWARGANVLHHNWHTIGICVEGDYHKPGAVMPKAQMDALHEAIRYCKSLYPNAAVKFHRDYGGSVCPGDYFPYAEALKYNEPVTPAESEEDMKRYKTVDELPEPYRAEIQTLINKGHLRGKGGDAGLDLTEDMVRVLIVCGRMQGVLS